MKIIINFLFLSFISISLLACSKKVEKSTSASKENVAINSDINSKDTIKKKATNNEINMLPKPYHPEDDAEQKIAALVKQAQKENKNIILQAGGNWCIWCLRFNNFLQKTPELKEIVDQNYLYYHLNFSPENENEKILAKYGNPGDKYGYPVLLVLDKNGKLIHTQETGQLEQDKGYSKEKVKEFLSKWVPKN